MKVKRFCVCSFLLAGAILALICFQCYREVTMNQHRLDDGFRLMKAKQFGPAQDAFAEAARLGADEVFCLSRIAECQINLKLYTEALATCDRLNAVPGGEAMGYTFRGVTFERQGKLAMARIEFQQAIEAGNEYAAVNLRLLDKAARKG